MNRPQSLAGVKLSGCKNATPAERMGEHRVRLPKWGIEAATAAPVREDVTHLGVRAFYLERASGPGELPCEGDELWIRIPPDKVYLVSR